jgi:hypothetical protein
MISMTRLVAKEILSAYDFSAGRAETERTLNKPPEVWQAYDYWLQAVDAHAKFLSSFKASDLYEVRRLLEQSVGIDPKYARAWARLSWYHFSVWNNPLDGDHLDAAVLDRADSAPASDARLGRNILACWGGSLFPILAPTHCCAFT